MCAKIIKHIIEQRFYLQQHRKQRFLSQSLTRQEDDGHEKTQSMFASARHLQEKNSFKFSSERDLSRISDAHCSSIEKCATWCFGLAKKFLAWRRSGHAKPSFPTTHLLPTVQCSDSYYSRDRRRQVKELVNCSRVRPQKRVKRWRISGGSREDLATSFCHQLSIEVSS